MANDRIELAQTPDRANDRIELAQTPDRAKVR